jgi:gliding motility-associated-like protein
MTATLLHYAKPLPWLVLFLVLLGGVRPTLASHLLGGEMTYRYLDATGPTAAPHRYEVSVSVYVACNSNATTSGIYLDIYDAATGTTVALTTVNNADVAGGFLYAPQTSISACTNSAVPVGCTITGASQPYQLQKFVTVINLPLASAGYYVVASPDGARNAGINNLAGGGSASAGYYLTLYATLAPPTYANHSPVFVGDAVGLICASDTTVILNNAVDADGDRLVYAFGQPYSFSYTGTFTPPPTTVPYTTTGGYSAATPLGTGAGYYAGISASTGITKYKGGPMVGNHYSVAVDVKEYRTVGGVEVLLGTTRRDMQLVVGNCPPTTAPVLPTSTVLPRSYTIQVGSTLSVPITSTQVDGHSLTLTATSSLLDGAGGYAATFAGNAGTLPYVGSPLGAYTVAGPTNGTVAGTFAFTPACTDARSTPYDVTITAKDVGCAGKVTADVLHITVVQPTGPTTIAGSLAVCGLNTTQTYTATGGTAPGVRWTVAGGTIVGSATANPVTVSWPSTGMGSITAQGVTQYGCLVDLITKNVTISPATPLTVAGGQAICQGGSATLTVTGGTAPYTLTGGAAPVSGAGPFVLSPAQTTTYTITSTAGSGCAAAAQATITVNQLPVAAAGAAVTICPGGTAQLGAAPVAGTTYHWSPATGLNSTTVASPTVTLPNTSGVPFTQTYTLTATSTASGCQATSTVVVSVSPPLAAAPGAAITICSGGAGQLGAAPVAGLTYSWSPATGLSSATAANPTVTLTNPTGAPATQAYTLTVTNASGCASTGTVAVTVQPALLPGTIGADQVMCAGAVPALLTGTAAAGGGSGTYVYQWESSPDDATWTALANVTTLTCAPGPVAATTYFRRRVAMGTCGTAYSNVVKVTAQSLLVPAVALPTRPAQCAGAAFTFTPVPTNAGAAPTYQWFVNGAAIGAGPSYTSTTLADGDLVRVELTPTAGFCASGVASATCRVSLTPVPAPTASILPQTALPVCAGAPVTFGLGQATNAGPNPQYQWQVDGVSVAGATKPSFTSTTLRDGQAVTLVLRTTNACGQPATATSAPVRVAINTPVQVSAGPNKTIMEGETVVLEGTADGNYPVAWSPSQTLSFEGGSQLRPVAAPLVTTTYALSAGAGYCGSSSSVTVTVLPRIRIPNAFSPNGDNNDDTWQIDNIEAYPSSRVIVFDRWGMKVFETASYGRGSEWRGTINGQPAPFGTYYYLITLGNGKSLTGPLTVIN